MLDVFHEIQKQREDAVLLLVGGNGNLEEQVRQKVTDLGLSDRVIFTGVRSDIPQLMSAMDVFVTPSFFEGMPNTVIERRTFFIQLFFVKLKILRKEDDRHITYQSSSLWSG